MKCLTQQKNDDVRFLHGTVRRHEGIPSSSPAGTQSTLPPTLPPEVRTKHGRAPSLPQRSTPSRLPLSILPTSCVCGRWCAKGWALVCKGGQQYGNGDGGSHEFNPITHVPRKTGMSCCRGADCRGSPTSMCIKRLQLWVLLDLSMRRATGAIFRFWTGYHARDISSGGIGGACVPKTYRLVYN